VAQLHSLLADPLSLPRCAENLIDDGSRLLTEGKYEQQALNATVCA
jgi:hypothetical protein